MDWLVNGEIWVALISLTAMEIVLGIDNIIFISILAARLPENQQKHARLIGLGLAMVTRILLLCSLAWVMSLTTPLFAMAGQEISWRDLLLIGGGIFLVTKATKEIHSRIELDEGDIQGMVYQSFVGTLIQIAILDMVFSLDSIITAVGMVDQIWVMVVAVIAAVLIMMVFSGPVSLFILKFPTLKMLALSFLLLIGVVLIAEGFGQHINKAYIYAAMVFSIFVETLNLTASTRKKKRLQLQAARKQTVLAEVIEKS